MFLGRFTRQALADAAPGTSKCGKQNAPEPVCAHDRKPLDHQPKFDFIDMGMWDAIRRSSDHEKPMQVRPQPAGLHRCGRPSLKHDSTAVVAVASDQARKVLSLVTHPSTSADAQIQPLDFEATIEAEDTPISAASFRRCRKFNSIRGRCSPTLATPYASQASRSTDERRDKAAI